MSYNSLTAHFLQVKQFFSDSVVPKLSLEAMKSPSLVQGNVYMGYIGYTLSTLITETKDLFTISSLLQPPTHGRAVPPTYPCFCVWICLFYLECGNNVEKRSLSVHWLECLSLKTLTSPWERQRAHSLDSYTLQGNIFYCVCVVVCTFILSLFTYTWVQLDASGLSGEQCTSFFRHALPE